MDLGYRKIGRVLLVALLANLVLAFGKFYAGWRLDCLALLADALHSLFGAAVCLVSLLAVFRDKSSDLQVARRRCRFESVSLLVVSVGLLLGCWELLGTVVQNGWHPALMPVFSRYGLWFLAVALGVNFVLSRLQRNWADDFKTHLFTTALTVLSLYSTQLGWPRYDAIAAGIIVILVALAISVLVYEHISRLSDAVARGDANDEPRK